MLAIDQGLCISLNLTMQRENYMSGGGGGGCIIITKLGGIQSGRGEGGIKFHNG